MAFPLSASEAQRSVMERCTVTMERTSSAVVRHTANHKGRFKGPRTDRDLRFGASDWACALHPTTVQRDEDILGLTYKIMLKLIVCTDGGRVAIDLLNSHTDPKQQVLNSKFIHSTRLHSSLTGSV